MSEPAITLSRELAMQLLKHAQTSPQARVCGLVLGTDAQAREIVHLRNQAESPEMRHAIDAQEFARAVSSAQTRGLQPLAVYHSHPDSPPMPDDDDRAASPDSTLRLLVISLNIKGVLEMRAFTPAQDQLRETPVQIFL